MKKVFALGLLAAGLLAIAGVSQAAWYEGVYLGAGVGAGRVEADLNKLGLLPIDSGGVAEPIETTKFKKTSLNARLFAGWRFNRFFAVEGGYMKFYDVDRQYCFIDETGECTEERRTDISTASVISSSAWTVELPTKGWTAFAVGLLPFGNDGAFDLFVKVGTVSWETDAAGYEKIVGGFVPPKDPVVPPTNEPVTRKLDGTDLATGIGLNFNHPSGVTIRSEFEYYDISELDQSYVLSLTALYNF